MINKLTTPSYYTNSSTVSFRFQRDTFKRVSERGALSLVSPKVGHPGSLSRSFKKSDLSYPPRSQSVEGKKEGASDCENSPQDLSGVPSFLLDSRKLAVESEEARKEFFFLSRPKGSLRVTSRSSRASRRNNVRDHESGKASTKRGGYPANDEVLSEKSFALLEQEHFEVSFQKGLVLGKGNRRKNEEENSKRDQMFLEHFGGFKKDQGAAFDFQMKSNQKYYQSFHDAHLLKHHKPTSIDEDFIPEEPFPLEDRNTTVKISLNGLDVIPENESSSSKPSMSIISMLDSSFYAPKRKDQEAIGKAFLGAMSKKPKGVLPGLAQNKQRSIAEKAQSKKDIDIGQSSIEEIEAKRNLNGFGTQKRGNGSVHLKHSRVASSRDNQKPREIQERNERQSSHNRIIQQVKPDPEGNKDTKNQNGMNILVQGPIPSKQEKSQVRSFSQGKTNESINSQNPLRNKGKRSISQGSDISSESKGESSPSSSKIKGVVNKVRTMNLMEKQMLSGSFKKSSQSQGGSHDNFYFSLAKELLYEVRNFQKSLLASPKQFFYEIESLTGGPNSIMLKLLFEGLELRSDLDPVTLSCIISPGFGPRSFDVMIASKKEHLTKSSYQVFRFALDKSPFKGLLKATGQVFSLGLYYFLKAKIKNEPRVVPQLTIFLNTIRRENLIKKTAYYSRLHQQLDQTKERLLVMSSKKEQNLVTSTLSVPYHHDIYPIISSLEQVEFGHKKFTLISEETRLKNSEANSLYAAIGKTPI